MPLFETKWVVSGAAFVTLLIRRDIATAACIFGAISNALLAKVLKRVFNAARPRGAELADPGMPSSHAQSLFYFSAYLSLAASDMEQPTVLLPALGAFGAAAALAQLRVRAGLHTQAQVVVGATFGACFGFGWRQVAQPTVVEWVQLHAGGSNPVALAFCLLCAGAAVVGSVERVLASYYKSRLRGSRD